MRGHYKARKDPKRVVFADAENVKILKLHMHWTKKHPIPWRSHKDIESYEQNNIALKAFP
jgi:hypothetical protein